MRIISSVVAGLLAMWAAHSIDVEWHVSWSLLAVSLVCGVLNILSQQINALLLTFAACILLWLYTPVSEFVRPLVDRAIGVAPPSQKPPP